MIPDCPDGSRWPPRCARTAPHCPPARPFSAPPQQRPPAPGPLAPHRCVRFVQKLCFSRQVRCQEKTLPSLIRLRSISPDAKLGGLSSPSYSGCVNGISDIFVISSLPYRSGIKSLCAHGLGYIFECVDKWISLAPMGPHIDVDSVYKSLSPALRACRGKWLLHEARP